MWGLEGGEGGGLPPNGAPTQPPTGPIQGGGDTNKAMERMAVTLPWRPRAAAAVRLAATDGRSPNLMGQYRLNNDTRSDGRRGGQATHGGGVGGGRLPSQCGRRTTWPRGVRAPGTAGGGWRTPLSYNRKGICLRQRGDGPLHGGRHRTTGLHPC